MRLSKFSILLGTYIILSASFMQQVWFTWKRIFGLNTLLLFFLFVCLWIFFAILYKTLKSGVNSKRVALICLIYVYGFFFAWRQPFAPEKAHVLEYAVLAWLSLRDFKNVLYAFIFALIISCLDEGFQRLLPWRVFEIRDIGTNLVGAMLGIILFSLSKK